MDKIEKYIPFVMRTNWTKRMPNGERIPGGSPSIYAKMMLFGVYRFTQEPAHSDGRTIDVQIPNINTDDIISIGTIIELKRKRND